MDEETKNLLTKVLIWGGGAFLVLLGLITVGKLILGILSLPLWVPLLIGGGGYYAYRRLRGKKNKDRIKEKDRFKMDK